ncbi:hypothetical protein BC830DRAFT_1096017 [Chytriomyces sp. MP71]|nr:hypothetical protein BC830DRAFT_1096017 [Chytriomyces sp. MP71]
MSFLQNQTGRVPLPKQDSHKSIRTSISNIDGFVGLDSLNSSDYLTAGSLLKGTHAICLPVSAGLPSATSNLFKDTLPYAPPRAPTRKPGGSRIPAPSSPAPHAAARAANSPDAAAVTVTPGTLGRPALLRTVSVVAGSVSDAASEARRARQSGVSVGKVESARGHVKSRGGTGERAGYVLWSSHPISVLEDGAVRAARGKASDGGDTARSKRASVLSGTCRKVELKEEVGRVGRLTGWAARNGEEVVSLGSRTVGFKSEGAFMPTDCSGWIKSDASLSNKTSRKPKDAPLLKPTRGEIAHKIQSDMAQEKRESMHARRKFLQQRAEIVCMNHIMRMAEQAKFERFKAGKGSDSSAAGDESVQKELAAILIHTAQGCDDGVGGGSSLLHDLMDALDINHSV